MYGIHQVGGHLGGECVLVVSGASAVLIDSGFAFSAGKTADAIEAVLGGRRLDAILATHSHYDHISGSAAIKRRFPGLRIVASRHAAAVLAKPGARDLIRSLNSEIRGSYMDRVEDHIDELAVDTILDDGETLNLADMTVRAVATPGHTRCSMSYFFVEEGLLACSETTGIAPAYPEVTPCFIVGFRSTLEAVDRLRAMRPRHVLLPHTGLVPEGEIDLFFDNARRAAEEAANLLVSMHRRGASVGEIVGALAERYYPSSAALQPERAFVINAEAMIPRILAELGETPVRTDSPARTADPQS